jgi:hypothetical protein
MTKSVQYKYLASKGSRFFGMRKRLKQIEYDLGKRVVFTLTWCVRWPLRCAVE